MARTPPPRLLSWRHEATAVGDGHPDGTLMGAMDYKTGGSLEVVLLWYASAVQQQQSDGTMIGRAGGL